MSEAKTETEIRHLKQRIEHLESQVLRLRGGIQDADPLSPEDLDKLQCQIEDPDSPFIPCPSAGITCQDEGCDDCLGMGVRFADLSDKEE